MRKDDVPHAPTSISDLPFISRLYILRTYSVNLVVFYFYASELGCFIFTVVRNSECVTPALCFPCPQQQLLIAVFCLFGCYSLPSYCRMGKLERFREKDVPSVCYPWVVSMWPPCYPHVTPMPAVCCPYCLLPSKMGGRISRPLTYSMISSVVCMSGKEVQMTCVTEILTSILALYFIIKFEQ